MNDALDPSSASASPGLGGSGDPRPYIAAVSAALGSCGVNVSSSSVQPDGLRRAQLVVERDPEESAWPFAEWFLVGWTEEEGWYLTPVGDVRDGEGLPSEAPQGEGPWRMGRGVVPPPSAVASWVDLLTTMPGAVLSVEHGPYRSRGDADPVVEAALASYAHPAAE